jgi:hypothetical protein
MLAETIRGGVSDPKAMSAAFESWVQEIAPGARGWLGSTGGVTDDNDLFILTRFESEEEAQRPTKSGPNKANSGQRSLAFSAVNPQSKPARRSTSIQTEI